jgi:transposase
MSPRGDYRELLWQQGAPGGITKAGNRYLRQMLVVGAMAVIRHAERKAPAGRGSCSCWHARRRSSLPSRSQTRRRA